MRISLDNGPLVLVNFFMAAESSLLHMVGPSLGLERVELKFYCILITAP
jgi:hypothetical protein